MVLEHILTVARLRALLDVTRLVRSGGDVPHLLERIAETIADSLRFRTVAVNVYRPEWDDFEVAAVHGNDAARAALLGTSTDAETWQRLLDDRFATRGAYLIPHGEFSWDEQAPAVFVSEPADPSADADAWHHEDALVVPLTHTDGRLLGVISVDEPRSGRLPSEEEIDVLVAVADHAALALQQALESAEAERHRAKLEQLLELSARLNDSGSLDASLEAVCSGIRDVLGFQKVSLQLVDPVSGHLVPRVTAGWEGAASPAVPASVGDVRKLLDPRFEIAGCYLLPRDAGVARVGELDLPASVRSGRGPHAWSRHWLVVPLENSTGDLVGFVWADDPADLLLPGPERLQALRVFANHASSALGAAERSEAAADSDARKAAVVEAALDCVITIDDEGRIVEFNEAAEETLGWTSSEAIGTLLVDLLVPAWMSADLQRYLDIARHRKPDRIELSAVRSNGKEFEAEFALVPVSTPGAPLYTAFLRDVSKRKHSEELLRETELKYRSLVEGLPMATYINEPGLPVRTLYMSPQIETMLGYPPDEWLQPDFFLGRVHPDDLERVLAGVGPTHAEGKPFRSEYRLVAKDGSVVWVLDVTSAVCDEQHRPLYLQGFLVDVTERRETEEALRESAEQLRQSQKLEAVGALAGGIAHDFNNLLTAITGHTEFALDRLNGSAPAVREELAQIGHVAERASALTQQLLAFSRRQVLKPTVLDVNEVVRETLGLLHRVIPTAIDLRTALGDDLAPVRADRVQLEQVLLNLAVNGRDAMPGGGTLSMSTSAVALDGGEGLTLPPGPYVLLELTDTGHGMDAETQARIFEPFFTTKGNGGTGLGLATVYGIVAQSGGAIAVDSASGRGTTFRVYLPCAAPAARTGADAADAVIAAESATESDRGARVLVVEDEDSVRELVRRMLDHHGYAVTTCGDPADATALCEREPFDLLVVDVHLGGGSGRTLAANLLGPRPGLRVLFVSGDSAGGDDGDSPPGSGFLPKPFSMASLGEAVRSLLETPVAV